MEKPVNTLTAVPEVTKSTFVDAPAVTELAQKKEAADPNKRAFVSKGEKITNFGTYAGVDWLLNAAAGVGFAFWAERTAKGQRVWTQPIAKFFEKNLGKFIKDESTLKTGVGLGSTFINIIAGGMATIPPLLVLEHNPVKKSIVEFIDRRIYGKETVDNDPKFQTAYKEIEQAPHKSFGIGMITRGMALAPCLLILMVSKTQKLSAKYYFEPLAKASKWAAGKLGIQPQKLMETNPAHGNSDWNFIHAALAMDFGFGPFYAAMHSFFYNLVAGKPKPIEENVAATPNPPMAEKANETKPSDLHPLPAHGQTKPDTVIQHAVMHEQIAAPDKTAILA